MILVAVIEIYIVVTNGTDLKHFVRNIFNREFIAIYTITDEPRWLEAISNAGRFPKIKTFKGLDWQISVVIINFGVLL